MKICKMCKIKKSYNEFHKCSKVKDGHQANCIECRLGHKPHKKVLEGLRECKTCKIHKEINKFPSYIINGKLYITNSDCNTCKNKKDYERKKDKPAYKLKKRSEKLKIKYNISLEQYDKMYNEQNGCCKICNKNFEKLCVDHCHSTNLIRGLLCGNCNIGIGNLKDSIENLESAIRYLKNTGTNK